MQVIAQPFNSFRQYSIFIASNSHILFICAAIALIPVQTPFIKVSQTQLSLSSIAIIAWFFCSRTKIRLIFSGVVFLILVGSAFILSIIYDNTFAFHKIISSSFFIASALACLRYPPLFVNKTSALLEISFLTSLFIYLSFSAFSLDFIGIKLFGEVSFENQFLTAAFFSLAFKALFKKPTILEFLSILISLQAFISPRAPVFLISGTLVLLFTVFSLFMLATRMQKLSKNFLLIILSLPIVAFISFSLLLSNHLFIYKLYGIFDLSNNLNQTSYAWTFGLSQFVNSLFNCNYIGCGAGSTGIFNPEISNILYDGSNQYQYLNANLSSAYSLFFKLGIEFGIFYLVLLLIITYEFLSIAWKIFCNTKHFKLSFTANDLQLMVLYSFSVLMVYSNLVKDSNLWMSHNFPPLILFCLLHPNVKLIVKKIASAK